MFQKAYSQLDTGIISGRVTDPSGAALPNAQVAVTNTLTNFESNVAEFQLEVGGRKWAVASSGIGSLHGPVTLTPLSGVIIHRISTTLL
jgi:hypothetical protein